VLVPGLGCRWALVWLSVWSWSGSWSSLVEVGSPIRADTLLNITTCASFLEPLISFFGLLFFLCTSTPSRSSKKWRNKSQGHQKALHNESEVIPGRQNTRFSKKVETFKNHCIYNGLAACSLFAEVSSLQKGMPKCVWSLAPNFCTKSSKESLAWSQSVSQGPKVMLLTIFE
jgi:hypothetical protein